MSTEVILMANNLMKDSDSIDSSTVNERKYANMI